MLRMASKLYSTGLCAVAILALALGCSAPAEPVGSVQISPDRVTLPFAGFARVQMDWQIDQELDGRQGRLRVLLHLLDEEGELMRTFDHPFPGQWTAGRSVSREITLYQSALGPALDGGDYRLTVGIYDADGKRWPLAVAGEELNEHEYHAATVTAALRADNVPDFYFSEAWLPVEGGTDRQILARRWLGGEGVIRMTKIRQPGALRLRIGLPTGGRDDQDLIMAEGATEPKATVTASCNDFVADIAGSGGHVVEIPVPGPVEGEDGAVEPAECELLFSSNYELVSKTNKERRTIALESLAWAG